MAGATGLAVIPLLSNVFLGDLEEFQGQKRSIISPACSGSTPGPLINWTFPVGPWKRRPVDIRTRCPHHLTAHLFVLLYSELPPDVWAPPPISKAEPSHPVKVAHFGHLYPRPRSFRSLPRVHEHRWGSERDGLAHWELCLSQLSSLLATTFRYKARITDTNPPCPSHAPFHPELSSRPWDTQTPSTGAVTHSQPPGCNPPFCSREPWHHTLRQWCSPCQLYTRLRSNPVYVRWHRQTICVNTQDKGFWKFQMNVDLA